MAPTQEQLKAGQAIILAVAETVRECGQSPSGTLYAALMGRVSLEGFEKILRILQNAGLVEVKSHMVRWIGPAVAA